MWVILADAQYKEVSGHDQLSIPGVPNRAISKSDWKENVMLSSVELEARGQGCFKDTWGYTVVILQQMESKWGFISLWSIEHVSSSIT